VEKKLRVCVSAPLAPTSRILTRESAVDVQVLKGKFENPPIDYKDANISPSLNTGRSASLKSARACAEALSCFDGALSMTTLHSTLRHLEKTTGDILIFDFVSSLKAFPVAHATLYEYNKKKKLQFHNDTAPKVMSSINLNDQQPRNQP